MIGINNPFCKDLPQFYTKTYYSAHYLGKLVYILFGSVKYVYSKTPTIAYI